MESAGPSRTALGAARHRAAHQLLEDGCIFADPLAVSIVGEPAARISAAANERRWNRALRLFIAVRHHFIEQRVAQAVERGCTQLVVLGAGLDTFAYRNPHPALRVFEVDHPSTQAWKRQRLNEAGIGTPDSLRYVGVDFERDVLAARLLADGLDVMQSTFFSWLGVVPYLSETTVYANLSWIASLPRGTEVAFDYSEPPESLPPAVREAHAARAARVAQLGEPWRCYFEPAVLHTRLAEIGFASVEDWGSAQIGAHYFAQYPEPPAGRGGHVLAATV